jgi:hypothetical protein
MRSSNIHRNGSSLSRTIIKEEDEEVEEGITKNRTRKDFYPRTASAIQFSRSSIIGTHHGGFCFIIN